MGGQWYSDTSPFSIPWLACLSLIALAGKACCPLFVWSISVRQEQGPVGRSINLKSTDWGFESSINLHLGKNVSSTNALAYRQATAVKRFMVEIPGTDLSWKAQPKVKPLKFNEASLSSKNFFFHPTCEFSIHGKTALKTFFPIFAEICQTSSHRLKGRLRFRLEGSLHGWQAQLNAI
jgi:hypothetical protein